MKTAKMGRNAPCPCGSGKKYKGCCEGKAAAKASLLTKWFAIILGGILLLGAIGLARSFSNGDRANVQPNRVWSEEHGHYH